jgi:16S rRNA (guanine527-N7)-methyltransferase
LSEALQVGLAQICAQLALDVTPSQSRILIEYLALLQRWNATYNLTSVRDPAQMLTQHLADCLAAIGPLRRQLGGVMAGRRLLDVGSGGGLPGLVIAALNPELSVTCVDSVGKKAAFIVQAAADLKLNRLSSVHSRVEALKAAPFDVVTSRAFGSLAELIATTRQLIRPDGIWMAMKAKILEAEIVQVPTDVIVFHVEQLDVPGIHAPRCLFWMRSAERT